VVVVVIVGVSWLAAARAGAAEGEALSFRREVQPILAAHCQQCHGAELQEAGLRVDRGTLLLDGSDSGEVVTSGQADQSLLVKAVLGNDSNIVAMPPEGPRLTPDQIDILRRWIDQGANIDDGDGANAEGPSSRDDEADAKVVSTSSDHWSFQPVRRPALPLGTRRGQVLTPIDAFWLQTLQQQGLEASPEADRVTLLRRVSLDLVGLPPSREEMERFLDDREPDAYERAVDRLLASPAYGERWGRHWLDLARYADSNGYSRDSAREMFLYRDWVIQAINGDLPFDQFTIEQLSGDLLPEATREQLIATGFHRNTLVNEEGGTDDEQFRIDAVADRVATTGEVFLGLTLGCARCHSHKYDPISQREYYQLFAFFNNCDEPGLEVPTREQVASGEIARRDEIRRQIDEQEAQIRGRQAEFDAGQTAWEESLTAPQKMALSSLVQDALQKQRADRTVEEREAVVRAYRNTEGARQQFSQIAAIEKLRSLEPPVTQALILRERSQSRETHVHRRGNFLDLGRRVQPGVPAALPALAARSSSGDHAVAAGEAHNRLALARWIVSESNPLTARVFVNRVWQRLFGRGLVETENDFGTQGAPPTHPELLDWLASELMRGEWSVKRLHRVLVLSRVYRQSSTYREEVAAIDPGNQWYARQSRLRMEAEIVRDAALTAAGLLTRRIGGPSVFPPQPEGVFEFTQDPKPWKTAEDADRYRRGMYTHFWRSSPYPSLMVFDFPNSNVTCTARLRSNTPLQSLTVANDEQFVECAQAMAARVLAKRAHEGTEDSSGPALEIAAELFATALGRRPTDAEGQQLIRVYESQRARFASDAGQRDAWLVEAPLRIGAAEEQAAWAMVARVLLNTDEFITRE
jgi:mono/diheme cytochrome c family protein